MGTDMVQLKADLRPTIREPRIGPSEIEKQASLWIKRRMASHSKES